MVLPTVLTRAAGRMTQICSTRLLILPVFYSCNRFIYASYLFEVLQSLFKINDVGSVWNNTSYWPIMPCFIIHARGKNERACNAILFATCMERVKVWWVTPQKAEGWERDTGWVYRVNRPLLGFTVGACYLNIFLTPWHFLVLGKATYAFRAFVFMCIWADKWNSMVFLVSELDVQFCFLQVIGLAKSQIEQKFPSL